MKRCEGCDKKWPVVDGRPSKHIAYGFMLVNCLRTAQGRADEKGTVVIIRRFKNLVRT